jgi:DNA-binding MarR family transcriptional regulator
MPSEQIEHIGWQLWSASQIWREQFVTLMVADGYKWFGEARADLLAVIDRNGTPQALLAGRARLTRQAVQQSLDALERDGIVARVANPGDGRSKLVVFTPQGHELLARANHAKRQIEAGYRARLGDGGFRDLSDLLAKIT